MWFCHTRTACLCTSAGNNKQTSKQNLFFLHLIREGEDFSDRHYSEGERVIDRSKARLDWDVGLGVK